MSSFEQLPLPLRFDQSSSFDHYYSEDDYVSYTLKSHLSDTSEPLLVINGEASTGKSHLLNASALFCQQNNISFQYFEAKTLLQYGKDMMSEGEKGSVLMIDDIHLLANNEEWERKLYDLYNSAQRYHWVLLLSVSSHALTSFRLKDWSSRFKAGFNLKLVNQNEQDLNEIIKLRSQLLGLKVKDEVIDYLLTHFSRSLSEQIKMLQILDEKSLQLNRNITIPLIKEVFRH